MHFKFIYYITLPYHRVNSKHIVNSEIDGKYKKERSRDLDHDLHLMVYCLAQQQSASVVSG